MERKKEEAREKWNEAKIERFVDPSPQHLQEVKLGSTIPAPHHSSIPGEL
ncbi:hypothetical protein DAPPUDRAFT_318911 [Daphnia pulex]|uniref:Uncharacterized protein n=1 Tax=Daphnia pulex TaxID=6669 RepID=E9GK01_DAPPU|nr:hypothetical protein DAPPUDRAFT_318911 [Daphnia pulex]|eukprot:EFX80238.1 hypothetical protein DAPPUDRAFT_318911 [Daphnia pulex]